MAHALIPYILVRSKRRSVSLEITEDGRLLVRAPMTMSRAKIDAFVSAKEAWIQQHMDKVQQALAQRSRFSLHPGETLRFCGEPVMVCPGEARTLAFSPDERRLYVPGNGEGLRMQLMEIAKRSGQPWVQKRLDVWAERMNVQYHGVTITRAEKRWGSCSADGKIHFSWLLLFADEADIDYVMVHELAHRLSFDHSPAFWAIVERFLPDYAQRKKHLNAFHRELFLRGWICDMN